MLTVGGLVWICTSERPPHAIKREETKAKPKAQAVAKIKKRHAHASVSGVLYSSCHGDGKTLTTIVPIMPQMKLARTAAVRGVRA